MDFDVFAPGSSTADDPTTPTLRIVADGRLVFNPAASRFLDGIEFVQLLWDAETARIGILPASEGDPDIFPVAHSAQQSVVTSRAFVEQYALPRSISMRVARDNGLLVASTIHPLDPFASR